jgi:hypothetical protein
MRLVLVGVVAVVVLSVGQTKADFTFGEPTNMGPMFNTSSGDALDCFSYDGLEMYLDSNRSGGYGGWDIWVATRETIDDDWGTPVNLGPTVNTSRSDVCAIISADSLELYFASYNRPGGYGDFDIWITRRTTIEDVWGTPENLGPTINGPERESSPVLSVDRLELYFEADRSGGYGSEDIWVSRRATVDDPWGPPVNIGPVVNSSASESVPHLSPDGLRLFFSEDRNHPIRPGGYGNSDMWMTKRASVSDPWGTPVNLGPMLNSSSFDNGARISPNGSVLYFCSERPGGYGGPYGDIYQADIFPIVDFNGDGIVDSADMCIMVDHWGENYSLCDIGPTPFGDGIVDIEDLKVLAEHLFTYPGAVAYWKLDETEGDIAHDGIGVCDGVLNGVPTWQPVGGMVDGALELDGIDDYVSTSSVLNPADGEFSVFAWIKGGGPGQVVISQTGLGGANWLLADPFEGNLLTELKGSGRSTTALQSQTVITDGNWHRVGLVWDGSQRILYVDDMEVAADTLSGLEGSAGGLYIGVGNTFELGSFFSGLIDDVRIYNRAVTP